MGAAGGTGEVCGLVGLAMIGGGMGVRRPRSGVGMIGYCGDGETKGGGPTQVVDLSQVPVKGLIASQVVLL